MPNYDTTEAARILQDAFARCSVGVAVAWAGDAGDGAGLEAERADKLPEWVAAEEVRDEVIRLAREAGFATRKNEPEWPYNAEHDTVHPGGGGRVSLLANMAGVHVSLYLAGIMTTAPGTSMKFVGGLWVANDGRDATAVVAERVADFLRKI
jgi:hypothetical protein